MTEFKQTDHWDRGIDGPLTRAYLKKPTASTIIATLPHTTLRSWMVDVDDALDGIGTGDIRDLEDAVRMLESVRNAIDSVIRSTRG
jgi:hypothetical protein